MGKIPIDPALTEHDSMEEELAYAKWFREEVQLSLDEEGDDIPRDQGSFVDPPPTSKSGRVAILHMCVRTGIEWVCPSS